MAKVFLKANEKFTISENAEVIGVDGGSERILIHGAPDVDLDANVEAIDLAGTLAEYTFQVNGTEISIMSGANYVATFAGLNQICTVRFANGSADLVLTGMDVATLGGVALTTSATHLAPVLNTTAGNMSLTAGTGTPQFNVSGVTSVLEGSTATFTVTLSSAQAAVTSVDYALTGTGTAVLGTDTGVAVPGDTGKLTFAAGETTKTITVPVTFDPTSEPTEGLLLTLTNPSTGTALGVAPVAATVIADPETPEFKITSNAVAGTPTQEGKTIVFTVTPSSVVVADTTFHVNLIGSEVGAITAKADTDDFTPPTTDITFKSGDTTPQTVSIIVTADGKTENPEGYKIQLLDSSYSKEISSVTGLINDAAVVPTYDLTAGATSYKEGVAPVFNLVTTGLTDGTVLNYTLSGITDADITDGVLTGKITVIGDHATITLPVLVEDKSTGEGNETLTMTLTNGATVVDTAATTVTDSSTNVVPTYDLTAGATSYNEGVAPVFNLLTTGLTDGTVLNYTLTGITAADITGGVLTGTTTITGNHATITLPVLVADASTGEGNEILTMTLTDGTTIVDTAATTVTDSSTSGPLTENVNVASAGSDDANDPANTNVTYHFAAGTYAYTINNFAAGDVVDFTDAFFANALVTNTGTTAGTDGIVTITADDGANIITITLTGIPASVDGTIWNNATFNAAFAGALI